LSTSEPVLKLENLSRHVVESGKTKPIINNISFEFERNKIYTILGPSGAGKSSLLRLINRLDEPTVGRIIVDGKLQCDYFPCELRRMVGYLFQTPHLFPGTVRDNLLYARDGLTDEQIRDLAVQSHLKSEMINRSADSLSVGEKQRVALARLLATEPTIALLDEPTSALDPAHTADIERLITELANGSGLTVVMVTHTPEQALRMGGESLLLVSGMLVEHGPCDQVVNHPQTEPGRMYQRKELR